MFLPEINDCPIVSSTDEKEKPEFAVYPNPTTEVLHLQLADGLNGSFQLLNTAGQVLLEDSLNGQEIVNVHQLPRGIYFIKVQINGAVYQEQVVFH